MEIIFAILGGLLAVAIPLLIIGGIIYLILKARTGTSIKFSYRVTLRVYFYIVLLVSIGLAGMGGVSTLLKVGFGEIVDREFSYGSVYEEHRWSQERKIAREKAEQSGEYVDETVDDWDNNRSLPQKLDRAVKTSLINGLSLTLIGGFLFLVHLFGRRWVEAQDERSDLLRRLYLLAGLAIFAVVTIVSLAAGIPETLRYALLDSNPGEESPGEPLSLAIVILPIWLFFLVATIRNIRSSKT